MTDEKYRCKGCKHLLEDVTVTTLFEIQAWGKKVTEEQIKKLETEYGLTVKTTAEIIKCEDCGNEERC